MTRSKPLLPEFLALYFKQILFLLNPETKGIYPLVEDALVLVFEILEDGLLKGVNILSKSSIWSKASYYSVAF